MTRDPADQPVLPALAVLLYRAGGAFIHDSDLAELRPGWRVGMVYEPASKGTRLRVFWPDDPLDLGEAVVVEPLQLGGPG
jgi:hypothetical protein